jgi:hypothetical protein
MAAGFYKQNPVLIERRYGKPTRYPNVSLQVRLFLGFCALTFDLFLVP